MPTPRQIARQKKMFDAALTEFCRLGYHQANVDEIARKAEVGKATLYRHFKNKEGLFLAVYDHVLKDLTDTMLREADFTDYRKGFLTTIRLYLRMIEQKPDYFYFFKIFTTEAQVPESHLRQKMADKFFSSGSWGIEEIRRAQQRGLVCKEVDAEKLFYATIGMTHHIIYHWLRNGKKGSLETNAEFIVSVVFDGIGIKKKA